jgi:uncharacterized protein YbjT (DUF2867 family)
MDQAGVRRASRVITVLGATGRVTAQLRAAGEEVRAVGRSAERLAVVDATPWVGDASDSAFPTGAFRGADLAELHIGMNRAFNDGTVRPRAVRTPATTTPTRLEEFAAGQR